MTRKVYVAAAFAAVFAFGTAVGQSDYPGIRPATPPSGFDLPISRPDGSRAEVQRDLPNPKPVYKYELKPEHGEFFVVVKTFHEKEAGDERGRARQLAEGFAEYIRLECKLYAYVHESGWLMRQAQKKEKEEVIKVARAYYEKQGLTEAAIAIEIRKYVKLARILDEYTVFVAPGKGTLKNMDEGLEFAKYIRKLPAPPADFCDSLVVGTDRDIAREKGEKVNPFLTVFAGRNPTLPKKEVTAATRPKADPLIMSLNAGKPNSLIHNTKKDFTLVVQTYGTQFGKVTKAGDATALPGKSDGEMLERAAQQAHLVAEVLRKQNPPYEAYVLHTKFESFVCVGQYDSKDDPQLKLNAKNLARFSLKTKSGEAIETFMAEPMPAMIPRP
jgi:hypothetical protein